MDSTKNSILCWSAINSKTNIELLTAQNKVRLQCFPAFWLTTECRSRAYAIMICLSVVVVVVVVVCEHSSWPHAWPNKVHTLHAHAAISCIVAHQKLYHSDLYLLYSSHICMFILMSIVHEVINIATSNLTETHTKAHSHTSKRLDYSDFIL